MKYYLKFIHFHSGKCIWIYRLRNGAIFSLPQCVNVRHDNCQCPFRYTADSKHVLAQFTRTNLHRTYRAPNVKFSIDQSTTKHACRPSLSHPHGYPSFPYTCLFHFTIIKYHFSFELVLRGKLRSRIIVSQACKSYQLGIVHKGPIHIVQKCCALWSHTEMALGETGLTKNIHNDDYFFMFSKKDTVIQKVM